MQHDERQREVNGQAAATRPPAESPVPRILLRRRDAARACGISPAAWDRLVSAGKTPAPVRLGKVLVWRVAELQAWTDADCPDRRTWESLRAAKNANSRR